MTCQLGSVCSTAYEAENRADIKKGGIAFCAATKLLRLGMLTVLLKGYLIHGKQTLVPPISSPLAGKS